MILFLVPYVPIPRMMKRIKTAASVGETTVIYWNRGTDKDDTLLFPEGTSVYPIFEKANEGNPLKRIGATLRFGKKAYKLIRELKPNCIHVTKTDMLFVVWLYSLISKTKTKIIYEISDIHKMALNDSKKITDKLLKSFLSGIESLVCNVVDYLVVTSESFWTMYYSQWIAKNKVLFIPNTPEKAVFSNYIKKNHNDYCIGFIGKIRYTKQLKMLVDAAKQVNVKVFIAGNGVGLNEIKDYCLNMDHVEIYGSYNYESDIANLYGKVNCIFSMYDTEIKNVQIALPNRLYEAAQCHLPLIVSKGTELADIVETEEIGVSIEDSNYQVLVQVLEKLKIDIQYNNKLSRNCDKFSKKWDYSVVNQKLKRIYKTCNIE